MVSCAAMVLNPGSPLELAWRHTAAVWAQTADAVARHPLALSVCAAVPAALRAYILLRGASMPRTRPAALEILVTLWRVLLVCIAVWAACSGREWRALRSQDGVVAAWQITFSRMGWHLAHQLRMVLWELLLFVVAFGLLYLILMRMVGALARVNAWLREPRHRLATETVLRNLIVLPLALIYLVEIARPAFQ